MITIKSSENGFLISHDEKILNIEEAVKVLKRDLVQYSQWSYFRIVVLKANKIGIIKQRILGRDPLHSRTFEGPYKEMIELLTMALLDKYGI